MSTSIITNITSKVMRNKLFVLLLFLVFGCGPQAHFLKVSHKNYPPKPDKYDILVFLDDMQPEKEYEVIGTVIFEDESGVLFSHKISDSKLINRLKNEARKRGADALIDIEIDSDHEIVPTEGNLLGVGVRLAKRVIAKAIVFKENINTVNN